MNTHAEKKQKNKSQSVASQVFQKRSASASTFQFVGIRPEAIAQRKLHEMAKNSPRAIQMRDFQDMANNSPHANQATQLKQIHEASPYSSLGLENTGDTFSVLDGEVAKSDASLYKAKVEPAPVENKTQAIGAIAATAGALGGEIRDVVAEPGYTTTSTDMNKSEVETIDPFTHGHVQEFGDKGYLCLMYQQTHGFDGYVNGIEEGEVDKLGVYGQQFQKSMRNGKNQAFLGSDSESSVESYSNQHDQTINQSLIDIALGDVAGKADAITKLAGEGARFMWVRKNIATMTDDTKYIIGGTDHGTAYITFKNLWCTWKGWFEGAYNITEAKQKEILLKRAKNKRVKVKGSKTPRIQYE